jgi:AraC-like DNA-binding protein
MLGSSTSVFSDPDDYARALRSAGFRNLLIIGRGPFSARLTQVTFDQLSVAAAEEHVSRIAFVVVPADLMLILLPPVGEATSLWGGFRLNEHDLLTIGQGESLHARTGGPSRWGAIWLPAATLIGYHRVMTGDTLGMPATARRWRPTLGAQRHLHRLHEVAIRTAAMRPERLINSKSAHGLEQQMIEVLVGCLQPLMPDPVPRPRHERDVMRRFETLLKTEWRPGLCVGDVSTAIGVTEQTLLACCRVHLGMGPRRYLLLYSMQQALRDLGQDTVFDSETIRRYGFQDFHQFAERYRAILGR